MTLADIDTFWALAVVTVLMVPFVFLLRAPRRTEATFRRARDGPW